MEWLRELGEELAIDLCAAAVSVIGFCTALWAMMAATQVRGAALPASLLPFAVIAAAVSLAAIRLLERKKE